LRWLAGFGWLVASLLAGTAATTAPPEYFLRIWQTEDGLPQNSVNAVVQTRDGYLWLGTFNGLVRFDGTRFTVFDPGNTPALASSRITSLFEDAQDGYGSATKPAMSRAGRAGSSLRWNPVCRRPAVESRRWGRISQEKSGG
jgi:ligand-binding sensor domain-containing protein